MTPAEIREIVKITLDELTQRKYIELDYQTILKSVEVKLKQFFNNRGDGNNIGYVLRQLADDTYIDVILFHYRDGKTLECIAETMGVHVSTIKRNKQRLIIKIYNMLEELNAT